MTSRDQFSLGAVLFEEVWFVVVFLMGLVNRISFKSFSSCTPGLFCTLWAVAEHMLLHGAARQMEAGQCCDSSCFVTQLAQQDQVQGEATG